jgi:hypothetical protein
VTAAPESEPPALDFAVEHVTALGGPERALGIGLRIDAGGSALSGLSLNVRAQIRPELRRYSAAEERDLWELFGSPEHWGRSLAAVPWAKLRHRVGAFDGATATQLRLPCTFADAAAAGKYMAAIESGVVPLELLFSGTLSWRAHDGREQTAMVPWDRECSFRLPLTIWRQLERGA